MVLDLQVFIFLICPKSPRIQVCVKKGITPTFLFFSDGIGIPEKSYSIREGSGFLQGGPPTSYNL